MKVKKVNISEEQMTIKRVRKETLKVKFVEKDVGDYIKVVATIEEKINNENVRVIGRIFFYRREQALWLMGLWVEQEFRRNHIATKLISFGQKYGDKIVLCCYQIPSLIDLYQKSGFEIVGLCKIATHEVRNPNTGRRQIQMEWRKK